MDARRLRVVSLAAALLVFAGTACDGEAVPRANTRPEVTALPPTPSDPISAEDFDPDNFGDPTVVDNPFFPLRPGTQFRWEGHATDGGERISRAVVFTVTDLTKVIGGVRTVVAWDRDYNDGHLDEVELAFFAQDDDGNVWHFGQYPEEYDGREIVKTPTWIAGLEGARPGVPCRRCTRRGRPATRRAGGRR